MGQLANLGIGLIYGIILYAFINSIGKLTCGEMCFSDKMQKSFLINFIAGTILLFLAYTVFAQYSKLYNEGIRYGLLISGYSLLINTLFINWNIMDDSTKTIIIGISLIVITSMVYYSSYSNKNKKKKK
jgi:hypothetical protein